MFFYRCVILNEKKKRKKEGPGSPVTVGWSFTIIVNNTRILKFSIKLKSYLIN